MYQLLFGFCAGVYIGTIYDCKPTIVHIQQIIHKYAPPKKKDDAKDKPDKPDNTSWWSSAVNKPKSPKN